MRLNFRWPLIALPVLALAACTLGPTPPTAPPTPTPRARAEQIAQSTEVAARITATAAARAVPTTTPTPRPTLALAQGTTSGLKATPIEFEAVPLADGRLFSDPGGQFTLIVPTDWRDQSPFGSYDTVSFAPPLIEDTDLISASVGASKLPQAALVLTPSDVTNALMGNLRQAEQIDYRFIRLERVSLGLFTADRHIFRSTINNVRLQHMQVYLVANGILHIITFTTLPDYFEDALPLFDSILASYTTGTAGVH